MYSTSRPDSGVVMDFTDDRSSGLGTDTPDTGLGLYNKQEGLSSSPKISHLSDSKVTLANQMPVVMPHSTSAEDKSSTSVNESLTFSQVAEWAVESQKLQQQSQLSKPRSLSVQLNNRPSIAKNNKWKSSTGILLEHSRETESESRPASAMLGNKLRVPLYANKEGVQLRGDKGRARRKSAAAQSSRGSSATTPTVSNEWQKSFIVPYSPRKKATKLVRKIIEPPRIGLLDPDPRVQKDDKEKSKTGNASTSTSRSSLYHQSHGLDGGKPGFQYNKPKHKHIEIHYESYLPKDQWLEMKPKRFTKNHKHGNHFELRKLNDEQEASSSSGGTRKEAFVWENPYQIWLMEKTHAD